MLNRQANLILSLTRAALPVLVVAAMLIFANEATACPTCKDGIAENDPASAAQAAGYFYSILFMMAMPFLLLGTLGGAAYFSIRRASAQQSETDFEAVSLASGHSSS